MSTQQLSACMVLLGVLLAGCGGGSGDAQSACSLSNPGGCGGTLQPPKVPDPVPTPVPPPPPDPAVNAASVVLVLSNSELASAGLPGSEVGVTALVKSAQNTAVADATVEFSADSGFLAVASGTTDKSGKAGATLGTGGSVLNRPIKVTVKVGSQSASAVVNVVGTALTVAAPNYVTVGSSADLLATLVDSSGRPVPGASLSASSSNGNALTLGAAATDSQGRVALKLAATQRGSEQVTLAALGASTVRSIMVGGSDVTLTPGVAFDAFGNEILSQAAVGACVPVDGRYAAASTGSVTLNASRGTLYGDSACATLLTSAPLALTNGAFPRSYIKSANAGFSSIDATIQGGPSGGTRLEFVAALLPSSTLNLQPDVAVVGPGEHATLTAVVRDGTSANNLVKGATVQFSILADPSGGNLQSPLSAVTGSDGVARAVFVAGPADGGKDATLILASVAERPLISATTRLTVNKKALSIQFGTGNTLIEYSPAVLQQDFAVFVSDSAGMPVRDVVISATASPTYYRKGRMEWVGRTPGDFDHGSWQAAAGGATCPNEDLQRKGLYEAAFDTNGNGRLDPGIPLSIGVSGKSDALGLATLSLRYPADRAYWVRVELTVTGTVAGTESVARHEFLLEGLAKNYSVYAISPPGKYSPYGMAGSCDNPN